MAVFTLERLRTQWDSQSVKLQASAVPIWHLWSGGFLESPEASVAVRGLKKLDFDAGDGEHWQ